MPGEWSLDHIPSAIVVYGRGGEVTDANTAACRLLGVTRESLLGTLADRSGWTFAGGPGKGARIHPVGAVLASGQPHRGTLARTLRPDGSETWFLVDATPDVDASGAVEQVVTCLADVTELVRSGASVDLAGGEAIVDAVTERLAQAPSEPEAILADLTEALSELRPGIWVAGLIGKDPSEMRMVAAQGGGNQMADYVEAIRLSDQATSAPISSRVVETGEALLIPRLSPAQLVAMFDDDVRGRLDPRHLPPPGQDMSLCIVPMRARGAIIGTLGLFERRAEPPLGEEDVAWIQAVADRAGLAVESAQLYDDAVKRRDRLSSLQNLGLAISASPDLRLTLKVILDQVTAQLHVDAADVLLLDESEGALALTASTGFHATAVPDYRLPVDDSLPGRTLLSRRIETVTALGAFTQFRRRSLFAREGFKAYGAVPLITRGKLAGVLEVFHRKELATDQEWLSFLEALGSVAAIAVDNSAMQERLKRAPAPGTQAAPRRDAAPAGPDLTRLERRILQLLAEGLSNREIAVQVHLSQNTVKFHVRQLLQKTGATNRTELAHQATRDGWL